MIKRPNRIRKNEEFQEIFASKKVLSSTYFRLHFDFMGGANETGAKPQATEQQGPGPTQLGSMQQGAAKLGVIVSKKVSNKAAKRNKLKRRIKAVFAQHRLEKLDSLRLVVVAKPQSIDLDFEQIKIELNKLLGKIKT